MLEMEGKELLAAIDRIQKSILRKRRCCRKNPIYPAYMELSNLWGGFSFAQSPPATDIDWADLHLEKGKIKISKPVNVTLPGSEDFCWTSEGSILMGNNSKLYKFPPKEDKNWQEIVDLAPFGLTKITRLAVSPKGDKIAIVSGR